MPPITDKLCDLCEREAFILDLFTDLVGKNNVSRRRTLGRVIVRLRMAPVLSLALGKRALTSLSTSCER